MYNGAQWHLRVFEEEEGRSFVLKNIFISINEVQLAIFTVTTLKSEGTFVFGTQSSRSSSYLDEIDPQTSTNKSKHPFLNYMLV